MTASVPTDYTVSVPVTAYTPDEAAHLVIDAMGMDEYSVNDIGGVQVETAHTLVLICRGCDEKFKTLLAAQEHGVYIPGPDPAWCGEAGFDLAPEEML